MVRIWGNHHRNVRGEYLACRAAGQRSQTSGGGPLVNLRFSLREAEEIELRGLVRHHVYGCGGEFVEVLPDQQMQLMDYLDRFDDASA